MKNSLNKLSMDTLQIIFIFLPFMLLVIFYQLGRLLSIALPKVSLEFNFVLWTSIYFIAFSILFVFIKFKTKTDQPMETSISSRPYMLAILCGFIVCILHIIGLAIFDNHGRFFVNLISWTTFYVICALLIKFLLFFSVFYKTSKKVYILHTVIFHTLTQFLILISFIAIFPITVL